MTGEGDGSALAGWIAPTQATNIDRVPLAEIHEGWAPERVGELPLASTVAMIRSVGIVDPVLLRPRAEGGYEVVAGRRIVEAAREAGLERVPAVVRHMDDAQALMALALDGSSSGAVTVAAAADLRARLAAAGVPEEDAEDVLAAVPVEAPAPPAPVVPEPVVAEPVPVAAAVSAPAPAAPTPAVRGAIEGSERADRRWIPLPAGRPRLTRLSSAFADAPRMLRLLAADSFTGTIELAGTDGRRDAVTFLDGACIAVSVEKAGSRVAVPLRLPAPDQGPVVEITVRPHPATVVIALALALRTPARLVGLDASFVWLPGLLQTLSRQGGDAAVVVSAPRGAGVVLISGGEPISAYARREGEEPGEIAETTDVDAVNDLLTGGVGEVDVHDGPLVAPIDLDELIDAATTGA